MTLKHCIRPCIREQTGTSMLVRSAFGLLSGGMLSCWLFYESHLFTLNMWFSLTLSRRRPSLHNGTKQAQRAAPDPLAFSVSLCAMLWDKLNQKVKEEQVLSWLEEHPSLKLVSAWLDTFIIIVLYCKMLRKKENIQHQVVEMGTILETSFSCIFL